MYSPNWESNTSPFLLYDTWRHNSSNQAAVTSIPLRSLQAMMFLTCIMSDRLVHLLWPIYSEFWMCFPQSNESKCTMALWNWPHRSSPFLYKSPCINILQTHKIVMMLLTVVAVILVALINSSVQHQTQRQNSPCPIGAQPYGRVKNKEAYIVYIRCMLQWWSR